MATERISLAAHLVTPDASPSVAIAIKGSKPPAPILSPSHSLANTKTD